MVNWTEAELAAHMHRIANMKGPYYRHQGNGQPDQPDDGPESSLQDKVVAYAHEKGWPCLSFRQSRKARGFLVPGWPDITLCLPEGRVLFLELKTGKGRMSEDQKQIARSMLFFKHEWHVVRSFKRFLEIVCG